jgi:sucrose-6-phosphate hydrolase SacC (GH32 family)
MHRTLLALVLVTAGLPGVCVAADEPPLRNPVWVSADNLRDPAVLPVPGGYQIFYSRLAGTNWANPASWTIARVFTKDFRSYEPHTDLSPHGHASPGDIVKWHGRYILPYQTYPTHPARLCFAESADLRDWSAPKIFLEEAARLPWNTLGRVIDPSLVVDGDVMHCFFVGSRNVTNGTRIIRANLLGHAITRDPALREWEILSRDAPLLGLSERAPDGVENVMVFRTGDHWTMIYSEGLAKQHLAITTSPNLRSWSPGIPLEFPSQKWMSRKHGAPFVWQEGGRWRMILMGEGADRRTTFGLLESGDARNWTLLPER